MINSRSLFLCSALGLSACMSSPQQTTSLPDYLQPYIDQSASSIQQQIARSIGYEGKAC